MGPADRSVRPARRPAPGGLQRPGQPAHAAVRRLLRGAGRVPAAHQHPARPPPGDLPRLLVGRGAPVHVLRAQRHRHGLPLQVAGPGLRRARRAAGPVRHGRLRGRRQHPRQPYYKSLLPDLAADDRQRRIFFEIKANVTRAQVQALVAAGVTWVQPGIESLHSEVLKLMDKGIQGWQNVQLLKWSRESGLRLSWSMLWGFPGDKDDWYADMAAWLPALEHLPAAREPAGVRFDRYSVYHEQARRLGLILFPIGAMSLVYPLPARRPRRARVLLQHRARRRPAALRAVADATRWPGTRASRPWPPRPRAWRAAYGGGRQPVLVMDDQGDHIQLTDTRGCATQPRHVLAGLAREVYLACDAAPRRARLAQAVPAATDDQLAAVTGQLLADHLVIEMDGRLIALAVPVSGAPATPDYTQFPGGHVFAGAGRPDAESPMTTAISLDHDTLSSTTLPRQPRSGRAAAYAAHHGAARAGLRPRPARPHGELRDLRHARASAGQRHPRLSLADQGRARRGPPRGPATRIRAGGTRRSGPASCSTPIGTS